MKNYTCSEIGMLTGAGIGGAISIAGFVFWHNVLIFVFILIGIAAGVLLGNMVDKKKAQDKKS